jgi:hypothetical protein
MINKKVKLSELGRTTKKEHLQMVHPFLRQEFRTIERKELTSEKVFKELFGEETEVELWKLIAIYEYQN